MILGNLPSSAGDAVPGDAVAGPAALDETYRLVALEAVIAPDGCAGRNWHLYRIAQGENEITGYRQGEIGRIRTDVELIVVALNERRQWSKSKERPRNHGRSATARRTPG